MAVTAFEFAPGLVLRVTGEPKSVAHLQREYGPTETSEATSASVEIAFGPESRDGDDPGLDDGPRSVARHKTVGWRVRVGSPDHDPLTSRIELRGQPASVARSLVQGYVVEPMLSIAAARAGYVALPAAAIVTDDGPLVLMGRSRAGKSTLAARALAMGHDILGDDQILVTSSGLCRAYPRRLRLYPDLVETAPDAFARLPRRTRATLRLRGLVATGTRGYVRPSLPVDRSELGGRWVTDASRPCKVVIIERGGPGDDLRRDSVDRDHAISVAAMLLQEQRARLVELGGEAWAAASRATLELERTILGKMLGGSPVERLVVPSAWNAAKAVASTERLLGL
jgi:hypothetical protein